jgi:beta-lactamase regulating signal transducer with metallopeptidase domain
MIALLLDILVKATALLVAAALADAVLARRASAASRHLVWALAMTALLLLPLAIAALPHWQLRIPVERTAIVAAADSWRAASGQVTAVPESSAIATVTPAAAATWPSSATLTVAALAIFYLGGVLLLLARLVAEPFALRRLTREAARVPDGDWRTLLETCARDMGVRGGVRLLRSAGEVMPLTFGTIQPTIVLPASAEAWTGDRRRAVLLHELAHIARRDCLVQRVGAVASALYWPHPGVWFAARRLRIERELACDDRVLAGGAGARDYAGHLLELAHSLGRAPAPATALGMARARHLEHRLLAILDAARNRAALRPRGLTAAVAVAGMVFVSMAILRAAIVPVDPGVPVAGLPVEAVAVALQDGVGTWELRRTQDRAVVQITIRTDHGSHGRTIRLDRLAGLPVDQIDAANASVHFPIRREAGAFTVDGVCRSGVCAGTFAFQADPAFAGALAKRGIGRPSPQDQLALALADVGLAYVDALAAAGYAKPDVQTLVRAAQHGVDAEYLRGMTTLGYKAESLEALIQLRDHGVDPDYIRGMEAAGYTHLTTEELRNARDHGADPVYAREMAALGFRNLPLPALINARDHGIDQQYVRGMQGLGHRLTMEEYRRTRDHGVDPEYVRSLAALGYNGLGVDALVNARDHGVDPTYVREMAALGYKDVRLDDLIRMRDHGVDPEYVRRIQRSGVPHLGVDDIIQRRDRGEPDPNAAAHAAAAKIQSVLAHLQHLAAHVIAIASGGARTT